MWAGVSRLKFNRRLLSWLAPELAAQAGVKRVQLNLVDDAVAAAAALRMENSVQGFDAMCSLYLDDGAERLVLPQAQ